MTDKVSSRPAGSVSVDVPIPFTYVIVHGDDPSLRSPMQKATTKSLHLMGLTFADTQARSGAFTHLVHDVEAWQESS